MYFEIAVTVLAVICVAGVIIDKVRQFKNRRRVRNRNRNARPTTTQTARRSTTPRTAVPSLYESGPVIYYANDNHNSRDKEYRFNYKNIGGNYRAYILRTPSFGNRDQSGVVTHRLWDDENKPYVCWDTNIKTLRDMQNVSRAWADNIQEYIATGRRFGPGHE